MTKLKALQTQQLITVQDAAVVSWEAGQEASRRPASCTTPRSGGALGGGFWGLLFGLIFFVPILGLAIGAASGALFGSLADVGISDSFIKSVRDKVTPGTSALFLLSSDAVIDRVRDEFPQQRRRADQHQPVQRAGSQAPRGFRAGRLSAATSRGLSDDRGEPRARQRRRCCRGSSRPGTSGRRARRRGARRAGAGRQAAGAAEDEHAGVTEAAPGRGARRGRARRARAAPRRGPRAARAQAAGRAGHGDGAAPVRRARGRWRAPVAAVAIILGCVLAPVSVLGVWAANQVSNTDRYVANMAPLIDQPPIQQALSAKITTEITSRLDVPALERQRGRPSSRSANLPRLSPLLRNFSGADRHRRRLARRHGGVAGGGQPGDGDAVGRRPTGPPTPGS